MHVCCKCSLFSSMMLKHCSCQCVCVEERWKWSDGRAEGKKELTVWPSRRKEKTDSVHINPSPAWTCPYNQVPESCPALTFIKISPFLLYNRDIETTTPDSQLKNTTYVSPDINVLLPHQLLQLSARTPKTVPRLLLSESRNRYKRTRATEKSSTCIAVKPALKQREVC